MDDDTLEFLQALDKQPEQVTEDNEDKKCGFHPWAVDRNLPARVCGQSAQYLFQVDGAAFYVCKRCLPLAQTFNNGRGKITRLDSAAFQSLRPTIFITQ